MRHLGTSLLVIPLLTTAVSLAAVTTTPPPTTPATKAGSCSSLLTGRTDWTGNWAANLVWTASQAFSTYTIQITTDIPLTNIKFYDGIVSPTTDTSFTVTPKSYFCGVAAGGVLSLSFQLAYAGSVAPTFTSVTITLGTTKLSLCSSTASTSAAATTKLPVSSSAATSKLPATSAAATTKLPATSAVATTKLSTTASATTTRPSSTGSASCSSLLTLGSSWTGGLVGTLAIPTTRAITTYTIQITTNLPLTSLVFYDGIVSPATGTSFTVTPKSYFSGVAAGGILSLGYQLAYDGPTPPTFTAVVFNNGATTANICGSAAAASTTAAATVPTAAPTTSKATASSGTAAPTTTPPGGCSTRKLVCYYPSWAYYRSGTGKYQVSNIPSQCSHVVYAFATLDATTYTMQPYDSWLDLASGLGNYQKFVALKASMPGTKFLMALGGWNDSQGSKYATLLSSSSRIANFVSQAVTFISQYGFDGLDLDYEYPSAADRAGFSALVTSLRAAFTPRGWQLTAAVSASKSKIDDGYDVAVLGQNLDAVHLMSYDLHGSWESVVNHHAPLYSPTAGDQLTVDFAVKYWLSLGLPKSKMVVGIPTYGRSWTLASTTATAIGSGSSGAGAAGPLTAEGGSLSYMEICMGIKAGGWTVVQDPTGMRGPYAYKGNQWVGYDDPAFAAVKVNYIVSNNLGGAMIWDLASDDFSNQCGAGQYPVINRIKAGLGSCSG